MTARAKLQPLEKEIQRAILDYLQLRGITAWRMNTGAMAGSHNGKKWFMRFGAPGMADIIGIQLVAVARMMWRDSEQNNKLIPRLSVLEKPIGRFLAIEVKRGIQRQSPAQVEFQKSVEASGGLYILARSVDDVIKALG